MQSWFNVRINRQRPLVMVWLYILVIGLPSYSSGAHVDHSATFPVPETLRPNVTFWKRIFTAMDSSSGVLHDETNVTIVYHTLHNLPASPRQRQHEIDRYRRHYQRILLRLAQGNGQQLTPEEARVLALFNGEPQPRVLRAAAYDIRFQSGLRDRFTEGLIRSGAYLPSIRQVFVAAGLPAELSVLPHVESSFNNQAYSKYGAAGMWQFTRGTGRRFLRIDWAIDERFDFRRATLAAAKLLQENYQELQTWPLAITAYNHGIQGMERAVEKLKTRDFDTVVERYQGRYFGFASKNFYAEFLAVLDIVTHVQKHFPGLTLDTPQPYHSLELDAYLPLRTVATYLQVDAEELMRWNPALREPIRKGQRAIPKGFVLYIPHHRLSPAETQARWRRVPLTEKFAQQLHGGQYRIQPGDSLSSIARRVGSTVEHLVQLNDLDRPDHIRVGHVLDLPQAGVTHRQPPLQSPALSANKRHPSAAVGTSDRALPVVKASLPLPTEQESDTTVWLQVQERTIRVVATETLGQYAAWLEIPARRLRVLNRLPHYDQIPLGTPIRLDFSNVSETLFTQRRLQYHRRLEEQFFRLHTVDGVITHTLKPGETLWTLAHQAYNVPLWLLQKYNHDLEFRTLVPGTKLRIPQVVMKQAL